MSDDRFEFYKLTVSGKDQNAHECLLDRLSIDSDNVLQFCSIVAENNIVKGFRAALNSDKRINVTVDGMEVRKLSGAWKRPYGMLKSEAGYFFQHSPIGYGLVHAFLWTKQAGFLLDNSQESLWQYLQGTEFNTPLIPEWLPWLRQRLIEKDKLRESYSYRANTGTVLAGTPDLDALVTEGLEDGHLFIPTRRAG